MRFHTIIGGDINHKSVKFSNIILQNKASWQCVTTNDKRQTHLFAGPQLTRFNDGGWGYINVI